MYLLISFIILGKLRAFPSFTEAAISGTPRLNLHTSLGYRNRERLFLTCRFTFFTGSSAAFPLSKAALSLFSLNYTPVCFHQLLESYLKTLSEHFVFAWVEVLLF